MDKDTTNGRMESSTLVVSRTISSKVRERYTFQMGEWRKECGRRDITGA